MLRFVLLGLVLVAACVRAETLTAERLGVIYNRNDPDSAEIAKYYALRRGIPVANVIGLSVPDRSSITPEELQSLRTSMLDVLPASVQSLLLIWSRPYAVECMSVTTAFAAGYQPGFCEPGCGLTTRNPLYASNGWLPADTAGWLPAMLLPSGDQALARAVIDRGIEADGTSPPGVAYLVRTNDAARNVRAAGYLLAEDLIGNRITVRELTTPVIFPPRGAIAYFTGAIRVDELQRIEFLPGAIADHLTSTGGALGNSTQMSAVDWLRQGATASYGTVTEPCNHLEKFPNPGVLLDRYLRGDSILEAYWKSVEMPGQGLFIGEPLARPYGRHP